MVADSPYETEAGMLTPWGGIAAGMVGAVAMVLLVALVQPLSGVGLASVLANVGGLIWPTLNPNAGDTLVFAAGMGLHSALGALFGLLYAVCQQHAARRAVIGTGLFYGFFLWLVGRFLIGTWLGEPLRAMVGTWAWLLACLLYGLCLASAALWHSGRRSLREHIVVPKD